MNILVVCQYYYPEPFRLPDICQALVEQGHSVTVVTGTPNYPEGEVYPGYEGGKRAREVLEGVQVYRCPIIPRKRGPIFRFLNYYSFVLSANRFLRRCKEEFDVVFINQLSPVMMAQPALSWAKRNGREAVLYCLDLWPESLKLGGIREGSLLYRAFFCISRRIYQGVDMLMVSSQGFLPYFEEVLGIKDKPIRYLPQYAEAMFDTVPPETGEKATVDFLFAGNVGTLQSVETIVEAASLLQGEPSIRIHIVGGGMSLEQCKKKAEGLDNLLFYGRRKVEEMPAFYAMADGMLISLVKDPGLEANLPGKVQSYMAAGKCIIGSIGGETARVIEEAACGLCSPAEDAVALARNIRRAAAQPEQLRRYGENARNYYQKHFRKEAFVASLVEILQESCSK